MSHHVSECHAALCDWAELAEWQAAMEERPGVASYLLAGAEPVLYEQVKAGAVMPTAEEIAAWRAANEGGGDDDSQKPRL